MRSHVSTRWVFRRCGVGRCVVGVVCSKLVVLRRATCEEKRTEKRTVFRGKSSAQHPAGQGQFRPTLLKRTLRVSRVFTCVVFFLSRKLSSACPIPSVSCLLPVHVRVAVAVSEMRPFLPLFASFLVVHQGSNAYLPVGFSHAGGRSIQLYGE